VYRMRAAFALCFLLDAAAWAQQPANIQKTMVVFEFRDRTLEDAERDSKSAVCLTKVAVDVLDAAAQKLSPLKYWSFQAGTPADYPSLRLWVCYQGGWNLCLSVADPSGPSHVDRDPPQLTERIFLPGEKTVPPRGCDEKTPEKGWTPLLQRSLNRIITGNRPKLEKALQLAPVARDVELVKPPQRYAIIKLPANSDRDLALSHFDLEMRDAAKRIVRMEGCGTGKPVDLGAELVLRAPPGSITRYVGQPKTFEPVAVYLTDKCPALADISVVGETAKP